MSSGFMNFEVSAKAPGKILWLGGYSVLERPNISFVTAVDAYVHAEAKSIDGNIIRINVPQLDKNISGSINVDTGVLSVEAPKEILLLKTSIEVALRYVSGKGVRLQGMQITTHNDQAFSYTITNGKIAKSGLGSSAAVTVAAIAAILKAYELDKSENDALHKLAQLAHSIATGKVGSGFDIAAAAHGTILYSRYSPDIVKGFPANYSNKDLLEIVEKKWDYEIEKFNMPDIFTLVFANFIDEGMITTAAIGSVSKFKEKNPDKYGELMKKINEENEKAIVALRSLDYREDVEKNVNQFRDAFNKGRILTKQLGVLSQVSIEDDDLTRLIEESVLNGACVAKLPGAGGRDSIAALCLDRDDQKLIGFWNSKKSISVLNIKVINQGAI
jgi:ERG8-type phosphomevalonate kinase